MYQTLEQKGRAVRAKLLLDGASPQRFEWRDGRAQIIFANGDASVGSCIRCHDAPCIEYRDEELRVRGLEDFPADLDSSVCPSGAITWEADDTSPKVDPVQCFSCGLCVSRCPVGAIWISGESKAFVNDESNQYFREADKPVTPASVEGIRDRFKGLPSKGRYLMETDPLIEGIYSQIEGLLKTAPKLPQHLTRNLMLAVGTQAAMRRLGDVNVRMELVFSNEASVGTAEVEMKREGQMDAPRNILDNIAVLSARYGFPKDKVTSLIVSLHLPNNRSDYWRVLKDIKDVLGVRIGSLTIGALVVLVWEQRRVEAHFGNLFYADEDDRSIRAALEKLLGRKLNISPRYLGVVETTK